MMLINKCGVLDQKVIGPINQNKKTRSPLEVQTSESRRRRHRHCLQRTVVEISMERPPPPPQPPPPQPPKETLARGYKFVWRILLISNLALGAYIFTRPRKKEAMKKDKKATLVHEMKTIPESEEHEYEPEKIPIHENQWSKPFKW
ncbi:unnamed protein product [Lactuca saligna]|uniref:Uncharacterized protein n=1 Tax=Lactuca saligna TaxID=75948 RepID=A0AA35ZIE2_LACSI|nr:unnamed protein product [Lactuca saligna]